MDNREYRGFWWLPSNPDQKLAGVLHFSNQGDIILKLIGSFQTPHDYYKSDQEENNIILGITYDKLITLAGCSCDSLRGSYIYQQQYRSNLVFIGVHFQTEEEMIFDQISVKYNYLSDWIGNYHSIESNIFNNLENGENHKYKFTYEKPDPIIADIDQCKISVIPFLEYNRNYNTLNLKGSGQINIELKEKLDINILMINYIHPLAIFLSLATNHQNYVQKIWIHHPNDKNSMIDIIVRRMYQERNLEKNIPIYEMMFSLDSYIQSQFDSIMKKWFNFYDECKTILNLYFATKYNSTLYVENRFLFLAQVLESYHRQRINNKKIHLVDRLDDLVKLHEAVMKTLLDDDHEFTHNVKESRNYYTHFNKDNEEKVLKGEKLFRLTQKMDFLLQACFLHELGFPPEKCEKLISSSGEYQYLKRIVNRDKDKKQQ